VEEGGWWLGEQAEWKGLMCIAENRDGGFDVLQTVPGRWGVGRLVPASSGAYSGTEAPPTTRTTHNPAPRIDCPHVLRATSTFGRSRHTRNNTHTLCHTHTHTRIRITSPRDAAQVPDFTCRRREHQSRHQQQLQP
jgi:hypothetical protein